MLRSHHISIPIPHKPQASIQLSRSESPSGAPPPSTSRSPSASRAAAALVVMAGGENRDAHFNLSVSPAAAASPPTLASAKKAPPVVPNFEPQSVLKRLQSELMALMTSGDPGISAFPEEDNIFFWKGTITGSKETVYEGLEYKLSLTFFNDYPFKPPNVRFDTTCFHPNVDLSGNICLDILQNKWSSAYDVRTILLSIQSLLGEPNNDSAMNAQAAELWANQKEFRKMVEKYHRNSQI